jgi:PTS system nitrogen regulatory IIA component
MKMSIEEIGQCLGLPPSTIDRWIRQGRIPIRRVGTKCVVHQATIEKWAKQHQLQFTLPDQNDQIQAEPEFDNLIHTMKRGGIFYQVKGHDTPSVLQHAVQCIPDFSKEHQRDLCTQLQDREEMASTGLGKGVAIPHPRSPIKGVIKQAMITTCFLEKPVPYKAIDDQPVFVLFILLSPSTQNHLHLLSRLAFCLRDNQFVDFLATTPAPEALSERIVKIEQVIDRIETD